MDDTSIAAPVRSNLAEYTVSELSRALKRSIEENFAYVRVRGEISGYKHDSPLGSIPDGSPQRKRCVPEVNGREAAFEQQIPRIHSG